MQIGLKITFLKGPPSPRLKSEVENSTEVVHDWSLGNADVNILEKRGSFDSAQFTISK